MYVYMRAYISDIYINKCKKSRYYDYCTKFITRGLKSNSHEKSEKNGSKYVLYLMMASARPV